MKRPCAPCAPKPPAGGWTRRFIAVSTWRLTPTKTGVYDVHYEVAAGLNGKAKARTRDGGRPAGSFTIRVSGKPADARVDPATGKVVRSYGN